MNSIENRILEVALKSARAAGDILNSKSGTTLKVDGFHDHDVKLEVDKLCENKIVETIKKEFPQHSILAEESGRDQSSGGYYWIIDPLDGTVNFYYGLPYFCVSIACFAKKEEYASRTGFRSLGRPVAAVILAPPTKDLFVAAQGEGATLNDRRISVSNVKDLSESIFCMGFGKNEEYGRNMVEASALMARKVRKLRCFGAAAYDIANVACGRLSGFYEKGLRTWDIAAAGIIIQEAGGVIDVEEFEPSKWRTLASAPGIYEEVKSIVFKTD